MLMMCLKMLLELKNFDDWRSWRVKDLQLLLLSYRLYFNSVSSCED